jgi:hypothetical protein
MAKSWHSKRRGEPSNWETVNALEILAAKGAILVVPESVIGRRVIYHSIAETADIFGMSTEWVRGHLDEFPNRIKAPGGDIRIPESDIQECGKRWRMERAQATNSNHLSA